MARLTGIASRGNGLHLAAGCQQWNILDVSGAQPPFSNEAFSLIIMLIIHRVKTKKIRIVMVFGNVFLIIIKF